MAKSSKTLRGATMARRLDLSCRAAWRCVLFLYGERAVSEELADKAAEELWLLSCEVADEVKQLRVSRELDAKAEQAESVSRETQVESSTYEGVTTNEETKISTLLSAQAEDLLD